MHACINFIELQARDNSASGPGLRYGTLILFLPYFIGEQFQTSKETRKEEVRYHI
uniref:Uncharacterized protein n=1 Tax=Arundo donax TaxID=35708 RepID=A0A0A8ZSF3_ARUDO